MHGFNVWFGAVFEFYRPALVTVLCQVCHIATQHQLKILFQFQIVNEVARELAKVYVRPIAYSSRSNGFSLRAVMNDQRHPLLDYRRIFAVLHIRELVVRREGSVASAEEIDIFLTPDE